jgi:hypothetical protein
MRACIVATSLQICALLGYYVRNKPEERRSYLHHGGSLKSRACPCLAQVKESRWTEPPFKKSCQMSKDRHKNQKPGTVWGARSAHVPSERAHQLYFYRQSTNCRTKYILRLLQSTARVCGRSLAGIAGSNPAGRMDVSCEYFELSGRGLCVWPITSPEESYSVCVCVCVCVCVSLRLIWCNNNHLKPQ